MDSDNSRITSGVYFASLDRPTREVEDIVNSQANSILQKFGQEAPPSEGEIHTFHDSAELWNQLSSGKLGRGSRIKLTNFSVTDWVPRWPGLYTTERAKRARIEARSMMFSENDPEIFGWRNSNPALYKKFKGTPIFRSEGKQKMLSGGTGCVRLAAYSNGGKYLCNAFTGQIPECGVPIELSQTAFDSLADEIANKGSASGVIITGILRDTPVFLRESYQRGIQRFVVSEVEIDRSPDYNIPPIISVPITFIVGNERLLVSFASFEGADPTGYSAAVEFLNEVYVKVIYQGDILTDFDETQSNFDDAIFSLKNISSGRYYAGTHIDGIGRIAGNLIEASTYIETYVHKQEIANQEQVAEKIMGNKYESSGVVGAMGDNAKVFDSKFEQSNAQNISPDEFSKLAEELGVLKNKLIADGSTDAIVAAGTIATAEESARKNDENGVVDALKNCGTWVLDIATKIGVAVAAAAIKKYAGL